MSVWVCWVRYTVHLRGGATLKGPKSRLSPADSTRTLTEVGLVKAATSVSTGCLPLGSVGIVCFMGCGQLGEERIRVALVKPIVSMEATNMLRSPWAALGMSGETARFSD